MESILTGFHFTCNKNAGSLPFPLILELLDNKLINQGNQFYLPNTINCWILLSVILSQICLFQRHQRWEERHILYFLSQLQGQKLQINLCSESIGHAFCPQPIYRNSILYDFEANQVDDVTFLNREKNVAIKNLLE